MEPHSPSTDRRRFRRHRVLKEAQVLIKGSSTIDCTVRDLSTAGAQLRMRSSVDIPDEFDFLIVKDELLHRCRKVWRTGEAVGVAFMSEPRRRSLKPKMQTAVPRGQSDSRQDDSVQTHLADWSDRTPGTGGARVDPASEAPNRLKAGQAMRVSITREEKIQGLLKKTHHVEVRVDVHFTQEQRHLIDKYNLGGRIVAKKPKSSIALKRLGYKANEPAEFLLPLSELTKGTHIYECDNEVQAARYEHEIREGLAKLKDYLDRAEGEGGKTNR